MVIKCTNFVRDKLEDFFILFFWREGGGININNFRTINTEIVCDYFTYFSLNYDCFKHLKIYYKYYG